MASLATEALVEIGERFETERLAKGWSLAEAATAIGSHKPNVIWVEKMKRIPTILTLARHAHGLRRHLGFFFGGDESFTRKRPVEASRMMEIVRANITRIREDEEIGFADFAKALGCGEVHARRIENGERTPSTAMFLRLAEALGVEAYELTVAPR